MNKFMLFSFAMTSVIPLTACTYSIGMAHTEGSASDVIDETSTNTPTAHIPVTVTPTPGLPIPSVVVPKAQ